MKKFKELKLMVEEKKDKYDEGEYDQEGDMAKSDLRSIMANAKELHDMIDDADNLPEWCQNKITLAEDYISTVANYLTAEMNEGAIPAKEKTVTVKHKTSGKELVVTAQKAKELKQHDYHPVKEEVSKADVPAYLRKQKGEKPLTMADVKASRKDSISAKENLAKARNEEVEEIDEITQSDLDKSAEQEVAHAKKNGWKVQKQTYGRTYTHPKHGHIDMNRYGEWQHRPASGISRGKGNLIAHGEFKDLDKHISSLKEEVEQIDEEDAYEKDRYAVKNGKAVKDNPTHQGSPNYKDQPHHVYATSAENALKKHTKKEEVEQIEEGIEVKKEYNDKTEAEHGVYHNGKKIGYVVHHKPSGTHTAYHSPQDDDDYGQIDDFRSHHDAVSQIRHSAGVGVHEEVEQIDELSNKTLYSYLRKTGAVRSSTEVHPRNTSNVPHDLQYQAQDSAKSRINARKGHGSVAPKGYAKEEVEQIDEKNVPTSPEKWAQAKAQAKAKFDVYPSAYANGWAAKKYKAMGGGWKSVSEAKEEPPFDKPYTTVKKVVTDKSGAKHSPMSRARDIARMAMKKQMEKMKPVKESLEESRKAEIVKEIMKKKKDKSEDAFQKDPELTTTLTKVI